MVKTRERFRARGISRNSRNLPDEKWGAGHFGVTNGVSQRLLMTFRPEQKHGFDTFSPRKVGGKSSFQGKKVGGVIR